MSTNEFRSALPLTLTPNPARARIAYLIALLAFATIAILEGSFAAVWILAHLPRADIYTWHALVQTAVVMGITFGAAGAQFAWTDDAAQRLLCTPGLQHGQVLRRYSVRIGAGSAVLLALLLLAHIA